MATVWAMAALILTTKPLQPIDPTHYSSEVLANAQALQKTYEELLDQKGIKLGMYIQTWCLFCLSM